MATKKRNGKREGNETLEAIKDLMILELGLAGVPQAKVRQIVGRDINRVNRILKHLKTKG